MEKRFFRMLACPHCKGELKNSVNKAICTYCHTKYPIEGDIPRLLFGEKGLDVIISEKGWDTQYKKYPLSAIKKYRKDPMIVSLEKFLFQYKQYIKGNTCLDLGCGIAWSSYFMSKDTDSVVGLDIVFGALQKSKLLLTSYKARSNFVQGNLLMLPLKDNVVDFIYYGLSIQYVKNTQQALNESYRVLKSGGRIVVSFPVFSLSTLLYHQLRGGDIPRVPLLRELMEFVHMSILKGKYMHYGYGQTFTISAMGRYFRNAGFQIQKTGFFDTYYPIDLAPTFIRPLLRELLHFRPFWPFAYIEAIK